MGVCCSLVVDRFHDDVTILDFDVDPSDSRPLHPCSRESSGLYFASIIFVVNIFQYICCQVD